MQKTLIVSIDVIDARRRREDISSDESDLPFDVSFLMTRIRIAKGVSEVVVSAEG